MRPGASYVHFLRLVEANDPRVLIGPFKYHRDRALTKKHIYKSTLLGSYMLTAAGEEELKLYGHKSRPINGQRKT